MDEKRNNRSVERRLKECLKHDRARIQVGRISHFGLLEMSRQRIRTSVLESSTEKCPHCGGSGHVRSVSSVALQLLRALEEQLMKGATHNLIARTRPDVALYVLNQKRAHLRELEERFAITITVSADETVRAPQAFVIDRGEQVHTARSRQGARRAGAGRRRRAARGRGRPRRCRDRRGDEEAEARQPKRAPSRTKSRPRAKAARRRRRRRRRGGRNGGEAHARPHRARTADDGAEPGEDVAARGQQTARRRRGRTRPTAGEVDRRARRQRRTAARRRAAAAAARPPRRPAQPDGARRRTVPQRHEAGAGIARADDDAGRCTTDRESPDSEIHDAGTMPRPRSRRNRRRPRADLPGSRRRSRRRRRDRDAAEDRRRPRRRRSARTRAAAPALDGARAGAGCDQRAKRRRRRRRHRTRARTRAGRHRDRRSAESADRPRATGWWSRRFAGG